MTMRTPRCLVALVAVVALAACGGEPEPAMQGTAEDEQAIRALADQYVAAFNADDLDGMADLVSENYRAVAPDGSLVSGRAGFRQMAETDAQMRQKMNVDVTLAATTEMLEWIDAGHATAAGTWTAIVTGGPTDRGSWLVVAEKSDDDRWRMRSSLIAEYMPPAETLTAPAN